MKFIHLSDLHLGIKLHKKDLEEDQRLILQEIVNNIVKEAPDAVIIAGDVFDTTQPQDSAKELYDWLVSSIYRAGVPLYIINGNHDPVELLNMCSSVLAASKVFVASKADAKIYKYTLGNDAYGKCNLYLLPYMRTAYARASTAFSEEEKAGIQDLNDAVRLVLEHTDIDPNERNILVTHQFIQGAKVSDDGRRPVGGLIGIDAKLFDQFDYVALGHLHTAHQAVSEDKRLRYCGTPLAYSFDETGVYDLEKDAYVGNQSEKSMTVVELGEKGSEPIIRKLPLHPLRQLVQVKGKLEDILKEENIAKFASQQDYFRFILTDKDYQENAQKRLCAHYKHVLNIKYVAIDKSIDVDFTQLEAETRLAPIDYLQALYKESFGEDMPEEEVALAMEILGKEQVD